MQKARHRQRIGIDIKAEDPARTGAVRAQRKQAAATTNV
jgi:hypothetical protein